MVTETSSSVREASVREKLREMIYFSRFFGKKKGEGCIARDRNRVAGLWGASPPPPPKQSSLGRGVHLGAVTGNSLTLHPYPRGRGAALCRDALALRSREPIGDQGHAR